MKVLECSSKGDKRFSAFYAKVEVFGRYDSIENHYQLSKRFGEDIPKTWRDAKGKQPTHLCINGFDYCIKFTESWYDLLWVKYLDANPNLVNIAKQFDDYHDIFKGKKSTVCQADTIRKYMKQGRAYILDEHKEFIDLMKERS